MANIITANPWKIDTASATAVSTDNNLKVKFVRWVGATTAGHRCVIQDEEATPFWDAYANATNYTERDELNLSRNGIIVPTLDSGTLYIYFA